MEVKDLLNNEDFLELLDLNDSKQMAEYLQNTVMHWMHRYIRDMFDDLGIFQDIAMCGADPKKKYKYIMEGAFTSTTRGTIDLRNTAVYYNGVSEPVDSEVIIDETTTLGSHAIEIFPNYKEQKFKLTFLGIPKIEKFGICIYPKTLSQIEIKAKADIIDEIKKLFDEEYILTNKVTLKNRIKGV